MTNPERQKLFDEVFDGVKVTFSASCISGLVRDCRCSRCLRKQNLPVTEETERAAKERSEIESKAFRTRMMSIIPPKSA